MTQSQFYRILKGLSDIRLPRVPAICLACLVVLFIRLPLIYSGLPYLYREDEAHHFNRTVEMVKRADLDPQYFHKPSLHFYLRMPVTAAAVWILEKRGKLDSSQDVRTRDPYGLAGYNFTASHPFVVAVNRLLSILLSVGLALFAALTVLRLGGSTLGAVTTLFITGFSPEVLANSPIIGVDVLMALLCAIATWYALGGGVHPSLRRLTVLGFICGLAVSSKYNALPIVALPYLFVLLDRRFTAREILFPGLAAAAGFFLASPYILLRFPTFLTQLAYEVNHYQGGHDGHSEEPGFPQALFYLRWLLKDGVGFAAALAAFGGIAILFKSNLRTARVFLAFPVLFAALMIAQRTNFTRNMVAVVPYVAVAAGIFISGITRSMPLHLVSARALGLLTALLVLVEPLSRSLILLFTDMSEPESRRELVQWIENPASRGIGDVAIAGELLMPIHTFKIPGVDAFGVTKRSVPELLLAGYDTVVLPHWAKDSVPRTAALALLHSIPGVPEDQRIVKNPAISIFRFDRSRIGALGQLGSPQTIVLELRRPSDSNPSCSSEGEKYCWMTSRAAKFELQNPDAVYGWEVDLEIMSPWPSQQVTVTVGDRIAKQISDLKAGEWRRVTLADSVETIEKAGGLAVYITEVHSPDSLGMHRDNRRLGLAIRRIQGR